VRCKRPVRNSFDHLVGEGEQVVGESEPERLRGLAVIRLERN